MQSWRWGLTSVDETTLGEQGIIADQSATKEMSSVLDFAEDIYLW